MTGERFDSGGPQCRWLVARQRHHALHQRHRGSPRLPRRQPYPRPEPHTPVDAPATPAVPTGAAIPSTSIPVAAALSTHAPDSAVAACKPAALAAADRQCGGPWSPLRVTQRCWMVRSLPTSYPNTCSLHFSPRPRDTPLLTNYSFIQPIGSAPRSSTGSPTPTHAMATARTGATTRTGRRRPWLDAETARSCSSIWSAQRSWRQTVTTQRCASCCASSCASHQSCTSHFRTPSFFPYPRADDRTRAHHAQARLKSATSARCPRCSVS